MSTPLDTPLAAPDLEELGSVLTEERTSHFDDADNEKSAQHVEQGKIVERAVTGAAITAVCSKNGSPITDHANFRYSPVRRETE